MSKNYIEDVYIQAFIGIHTWYYLQKGDTYGRIRVLQTDNGYAGTLLIEKGEPQECRGRKIIIPEGKFAVMWSFKISPDQIVDEYSFVDHCECKSLYEAHKMRYDALFISVKTINVNKSSNGTLVKIIHHNGTKLEFDIMKCF
jgi:hypothetical protein